MIKNLFLTLFFIFCITSCAQPQARVRNDFYRGLNSTNTSGKISNFERALSSTNVYVRRAAAQELAALMADGIQLSARVTQRMNQEIHGPWASALNSANNKDTALAFLLNIDQSVPDEARLYALRESEPLLNDQEFAAVNGHYAIFRLRYNEALLFFRNFQEDGEWPSRLPDIFIEYPVLINDLGRAFQYTGSGMEGHDLFLRWVTSLLLSSHGNAVGPAAEEAHFRLLFFAARIARRNGRNDQAMALFERSLVIAPNAEQEDACIWYILDLALRDSTDVFLQRMEQYVSRWHNKNYYNDILERLLQTLAARQDWNRIARTFNIIKDSGASIKAGYAWILARVIEEGYTTQVRLADRTEYLEAAYNAGGNDLSSTLYYRGLSAAVLEKPFLPDHLQGSMTADTSGTGRRNTARNNTRTPAPQVSPVMQFINGFFTYNAGDHAMRYIRQLENELSIDDLREAASALDNAGMYVQAIRLVTRYMNREDYTGYTRRDLEILFPCPYKDLVEKYAADLHIAPEILFGLIRTESAFQNVVVSHANAVGLTQLIPSTAQDMAARMRRAGGPNYTGDNLNLDDPEQNIHIGAYYLNYLMGRFENKLISLLAYNGGMNRIRRLQNASSLPADLFMETLTITETRDYGRKVMGAADMYRALYY